MSIVDIGDDAFLVQHPDGAEVYTRTANVVIHVSWRRTDPTSGRDAVLGAVRRAVDAVAFD